MELVPVQELLEQGRGVTMAVDVRMGLAVRRSTVEICIRHEIDVARRAIPTLLDQLGGRRCQSDLENAERFPFCCCSRTAMRTLLPRTKVCRPSESHMTNS